MANICDQVVVIVGQTDADMTEVLETMMENILAGPGEEHYFSRQEYEAAKGDMEALYALLRDRTEALNKLYLFTPEADSGAESSWLPWSIEHVNGHPVLTVEIGVKWGPSSDPGKFCSALDPERYACCIGDGGEYCEWEMLSVGDKYFDLEDDIPGKIREAQEKVKKAKTPKNIAYWTCLSNFTPDWYEEYDEDDY